MSNNTKHDQALIMFASDVLAILEEEKDWNSDTLQQICDSAQGAGLAGTGEDAHFSVTKREDYNANFRGAL